MAGQPELGRQHWRSEQRAGSTASHGQLRQKAQHRHSPVSAATERQMGFKRAQKGLCTVCCSPKSHCALSETKLERTDLPSATPREKGSSFVNPNPFDLCSVCLRNFGFL